MTQGPIWGNRNRTKKSQNLKSSSELTYRMYKLCKLLLVCVRKIRITVANYGQNNRTFGLFIPCWFFISFSDNSKCFHRNGFEMYILIIIYTVCTCDTLVPTRILNSEISWFCFDFPKWGPVSFIIIDFNVFRKSFHLVRVLSRQWRLINFSSPT
jgi:hypothetical protein